MEPRAPRLTPKSVHDLGRLPTHCHLVTRDFDMWYHEYDEETCVSSFTKGPNLLFACSAVCRGSTRSAATMLELGTYWLAHAVHSDQLQQLVMYTPAGAPTGTYHQGIARQFCHSEPPLTVVLGGVSPARVPHTDQWIPAAEGVVTSADETWMRYPLDTLHYNPRTDTCTHDSDCVRAGANRITAWFHKQGRRCYGLADLVKYLTPRLYRLTPEEIEQAKAQSIQEMETRAGSAKKQQLPDSSSSLQHSRRQWTSSRQSTERTLTSLET
ncbi:hypothetical protein WJX74_007078 [Apatococcus lobatus]|uniref:Uncharacterized protein n=1 Tax=Apatococcus lobatus TaxID=904363 RepID=A0AAW1Q549_9CHLO